MRKIFLIVQREYLSRVRKKSFLVMTLLGPVFFAFIMIVPIWLTSKNDKEKVIYVLDKSGYFENKFQNYESLSFLSVYEDLQNSRLNYLGESDHALLYIPQLDLDAPSGIQLISNGVINQKEKRYIEEQINQEIFKLSLMKSGIDPIKFESLNKKISIHTENISGDNKKTNSAAKGAGLILAIFIYLFIFMYGVQVMKGVIEEKSGRVIEVIISSVKPFELMMGKIVGIACVSLTQFLIWITLSLSITGFITSRYQSSLELFKNKNIEQTLKTTSDAKQALEVNEILNAVDSIDFPYLIGCFFFYFFGGYLLYSSLFAAIGSAVDSESDTQQFMLPVTIPLFISFVVASSVIENPDSSLAFWLSVIPLTSPVIMMVRLPHGVPVQELILSMTLLVITFLFTTWLAGRIYRVGILMYGKKINYKEISKWIFYN